MHFFLMILSVSVSILAASSPRTAEWNYTSRTDTPEGWGNARLSLSSDIKTPDGKPSLEFVPEYNREEQEWPAHLRFPARTELLKGAKAVEVTFWIKGDADTQVAVRVTSSRATHYSATRTYDLTGDWQKIEFKSDITGQIGGRWLSAPRLLLEKARAGQRFFIGPVTFKATP
ncbi:MAG: hypothetical protein ACAI35_17720 [Candidatus Methylacidiphilales bacterium]|nr:hypothetical protein [Candidatus Methylacidiphilales bacterium]